MILRRPRLKLGKLTLLNFHSLGRASAAMALRWRNSPGVRKWMYSAGRITPAQHAEFRRRLLADRKNGYWLVKGPGRGWAGVVYLNRIGKPGAGAWLGVYANPESAVSGKGAALMTALRGLAFGKLGLARLNLEVFAGNSRAAAFYRREGFRSVRLLRRRRSDGSPVVVRVMTLKKGSAGKNGI